MLNHNEKAYYKNKVSERRVRYEAMRRKFFHIEDGVMKVYDDDVKENNNRYRLNDGIEELYDQEDKLINVKKVGLDTQMVMRGANTDLRNQRDLIHSAH